MSTKGNISEPREAALVPQLSNQALDELKKGATVELWVECAPYTVQVNGVPKEERRKLLCSMHRSLIQHFSGKWKRDLADNTKYRVFIPFAEEPAKLVVGWMMVGGGNELGMAEVPYPKMDLKRLTYLKTLATQLEIRSLVAVIEKDIAALVPPIVAAVPKPTVSLPKSTASLPKPAACLPKPTVSSSKPTASLPKPTASLPKPTASLPKPAACLPKPTVSSSKPTASLPKPTASLPKPTVNLTKPTVSLTKPTTTETKPENRVCYYCNKPGHILRNCLERIAVHVTYSQAQTMQMKGPAPAPAPAAVPSVTSALQTVSPPVSEPVPKTENLTPDKGEIVARDEAGKRYRVESSSVESVEVIGPVTGSTCKVRITAIAHIG